MARYRASTRRNNNRLLVIKKIKQTNLLLPTLNMVTGSVRKEYRYTTIDAFKNALLVNTPQTQHVID
jgi:hypothetical protein